MKKVVAFSVVMCLTACSPENKATKSEVASSIADPVIAARPKKHTNFNINSATLDEASSNDIWQVISHLISSSSARLKGEYEKNVEYTKRMKSVGDTILYHEIKFGGYFAFKVSNSKDRISYNADEEELSYQLRHLPDDGIVVDNKPANEGDPLVPTDYTGQKNMDEYFRKENKKIWYEIIASIVNKKNHLHSQRAYYNDHYTGKIKVSPAEAKKLKGNISLFLVGKLMPPYLLKFVEIPFDHNQTVLKYKYALPFSLEEIWMVENKTGKILSKQFIEG